MKIAFIVSQFPSLSETFILNQITGLIDRGHEVDIFANSARPESPVHREIIQYDLLSRTYYLEMPKKKILRILQALKLFPGSFFKHPIIVLKTLNVFKYGLKALSLKTFFETIPFLDKKPYDIIHCHFGPNGIKGADIKEMGIKGRLVVSFHGYDMTTYISKYGEKVYKTVFEKADLLFPISYRWKNRLIEIGANPQKTIVHHMGLNTGQFSFKLPKLPQQENTIVRLLTVARLVEVKGIEFGIRAVGAIKKGNPQWNIQYDVLGDGPLRENLQLLITDLGLECSVRLLGSGTSDEVKIALTNADLFLLPSRTVNGVTVEGIPVSIMEAMATGLPVISTMHGCIPELVQDEISGFLVPERDVDALAERLEYLINNPGIWPEMGRKGRKFVEERFDIEKLNNSLVEIYETLIAKKQ